MAVDADNLDDLINVFILSRKVKNFMISNQEKSPNSNYKSIFIKIKILIYMKKITIKSIKFFV